jgi:hypothetical protein
MALTSNSSSANIVILLGILGTLLSAKLTLMMLRRVLGRYLRHDSFDFNGNK